MTEAQFARHRGVSKTSVTNWKRRGFIVWQDDRVRVDATDALLDARPPRYRGGRTSRRADRNIAANVGDTPTPDFTDAAAWTTAEACRRKEIALALTRELALERLRGNIVLVTDFEPGWARTMQVIRTAMLSIPGRARMVLQLDAAQTEGLRRIVHEALKAAAADTALQSTDRNMAPLSEYAGLDSATLWDIIFETMERGLAASNGVTAPAAPFREVQAMLDELVRREPDLNVAVISEFGRF